ncbi:HTH domain-containing protein [Natronosalvus caseinilyticus]|uniref:HTH domain-containing protein n=1 Tax=Natronosalvus caseinilyticus TaxID=2953747 RepID=UPI0028AAB6FA|nr:HTH domain-containing protein [Natronosalvus caseinilyticus]
MPGRIEETTPEDVLEVFRLRSDAAEPLIATEIAESLECSRRTALNKLNELAADGHLQSKQVGGRSKVFWQPIDSEEADTHRDSSES